MFENNLPKRHDNHIKETLSYKLFNASIPDRWMIRELSERDYGIDALIELVTIDNRVTGKLISIQLKSTENFKFNSLNKYSFYGVEKHTTNYWLQSNIPTFIFIIDLNLERVFYKSIEDYVRLNYEVYSTKDKFPYVIYPEDEFDADSFVVSYFWSESLKKADDELMKIQKLKKDFSEFYYINIRRDYHMLVDDDDVITEFNSLVLSIKSLASTMFVDWSLPTPEKYVADNDIGFDASYDNYFMYEYHMTKYLIMLDEKLASILKVCKQVVCQKYLFYWQKKQPGLVDFLNNHSLLTLEEQYWGKGEE